MPTQPSLRIPLLGAAAGLAFLLAWDASGLDLRVAQLVGSQRGFPLRDHWLLAGPLHQGARHLAWALALAVCAAVWWPRAGLAGLAASRRLQLAVTTVAAALTVSMLKAFSATSCPWDLQPFGGAASYLSHWSASADGGAGHCFPAGHASSGFAFLGGFFACRPTRPRVALAWLVAASGAGLLLGLVQQLRGAHFMSHTLWTGWICWCVALAIDAMPWVRRPWAL